MNHDAVLLSAPLADWQQWVRSALEAYREGDWIQLAQSPLAESTLVEACFLAGEAQTFTTRARALAAVLTWGVDKLRPGGAHHWTALPWRAYNLLHHFYLQGMRISELAEKMAVVEQTTYDARPAAFTALATVLRYELDRPQDRAGRRNYYHTMRYNELSPTQQSLMRVVAIFRQPVPLELVARLAQVTLATDWGGLLTAQLLLSDSECLTLLAHPDLRPDLLALLTPIERCAWHSAAASHYQARGIYLEAAWHFRQAGAFEQAAGVLIEHEEWFQAQHRAALRDLLREFNPAEVAPRVWAQLKLLSGNLAESLQDTDSALAEYGQALASPEAGIKAQAYYRRGRILKLRLTAAEALVHYEACVRLLETTQPTHPLLAQAALDAAWVYMEDYKDLARAEMQLQRAQTFARDAGARLVGQLKNAWGEWWYHHGNRERAIAEYYQARLAALEAQDVETQLNAAYNLGTLYAQSGKFTESWGYLQEGRDLAIQVGDRQREGRCEKGLGEYYFWLGDHREAARYYAAAYAIFKAMDNRLWLTAACYDLAEAWMALDERETARRYYHEGVILSATTDAAQYGSAFQELAHRYPLLLGEALSERQQQILAHLHAVRTLKSQECATLLGLSKEQALRELRNLQERGLIVTQGKGPATQYTLIAIE